MEALYIAPQPALLKQADAWMTSAPSDAAILRKLAKYPVAKWLGDWTKNVEQTVRDAVAVTGLRVLVVYNIMRRDGGSYSAGGAATPALYVAWIDAVARGLGGRKALVILEPDALAWLSYLTPAELTARYRAMAYAVHTLSAAGAEVYLDAGEHGWQSPSVMAKRLEAAGVVAAAGFALNTSHYGWVNDQVRYAQELRARVGPQARYVVDTSRCGAGPSPFEEPDDRQWGNWLGARTGEPPSLAMGIEGCRGFVWVKPPWESDGAFAGAPAAGKLYLDAALALGS